jgi:hypothetical protein
MEKIISAILSNPYIIGILTLIVIYNTPWLKIFTFLNIEKAVNFIKDFNTRGDKITLERIQRLLIEEEAEIETLANKKERYESSELRFLRLKKRHLEDEEAKLIKKIMKFGVEYADVFIKNKSERILKKTRKKNG